MPSLVETEEGGKGKKKSKIYVDVIYGSPTTPLASATDLTFFHSLVRDFDNFTDRSFGGLLWDKGTSKHDMYWNSSLFTCQGGNNWRLIRQVVSPAFTLSKMNMILQVRLLPPSSHSY